MKIFVRLLLCFMISTTMIELPVMQAHAGMISTTEALHEMSRSQGEADIQDFLKRDDVQKQLMSFGLSQDEAQKRIASLSDAEVKKLSTDIQKATVGGDVGGILVLVLVVVLIIYLVKRI
jgi:hypothetical protein